MERKIIQNAIRVIKTNNIYISRHAHDFVVIKELEEKPFIDGGNQYIRTSISGDDPRVEWLDLYDDSSWAELADRMVWGTYGKNGDQPLKYVFLKDCTTDHLEKISEIPGLDPYIEKAILFLLIFRRVKERLNE